MRTNIDQPTRPSENAPTSAAGKPAARSPRQLIIAGVAAAALLLGLVLIMRTFLSSGGSIEAVAPETEAAFVEASKPQAVPPPPDDGPPPAPGSGKMLNKPN
ncbi:MAG: hypothetical protein ACKVZJ_01535 [Phycisphaerales bacterium]